MLDRSHISCLLAGALACALAGCGGGIPETTFEAWANGVKSGNFAAIWEQLSPSARGTVLQIQVRDADLLSSASPTGKTAVEQAFTKNGIDTKDPSFKQARLQPVRPAELAADLDGVLKQFQADLAKLPDSRYPKLLAVWSAAASSPLGKSRVQGSRALATVQSKLPHTAENASVSVVFERVERLWALSEFEETAAPAMAGGPGAAGDPGAGRPGMGGPPGTPVAMAGAGGPAGPGVADPKNMPPGALPVDRPMHSAGPGAVIDPAMAGRVGDPKMAGDPARPAGAGANAPAMPADGALRMDANKSAAGKAGGPAMEGRPAMAADPKNVNDPKMAAGAKAGVADARPGAVGAGAGPEDARMQAGPGGAGGPGGPGSQQQGEPGSYQHAVLTFASQAASGQYDGLDAVISSKAKGVLADIRDQKADDGTIEDLKALFATAKPQADSVKASSAGMLITLKTEDRKLITLTVVKEKNIYRVKDMKVKE